MSAQKLIRIAFLGAILYISKVIMDFVPNTELISLLVIVYALVFGREVFSAILVFNLLELVQWGFGIWWVSYLYVWPLLAFIVMALRGLIRDRFVIWGAVAGLFGLAFGSLFAIAWIPVDPSYAFTYWIGGLPWDAIHCATNFALVAFLGKPLYRILLRIRKDGDRS